MTQVLDPRCRRFYRTCGDFSICVNIGDSGYVLAEHPNERYTSFYYPVYGKGKFSEIFKNKYLSLEERKEIYEKEYTDSIEIQNNHWLESKLKTRNIPTRTREPYPLPKLIINDEFWNPDDSMLSIEQVKHMQIDDFILDGYQSHPTIKAPLSN
jgi:hypothetical protein